MKRAASAAIAIATLGSLFLTVGPVQATSPTSTKDTLTREAKSVAATHTLVSTLPTFANTTYVVFDYQTAGFALYASTPACGLGTGTCTAVTSTTSTTITCTAVGGCSGLLTLGTFAGDNPSTVGSKTISITSDAVDPGISGSFAIPIVDSDQVTVTATVSPSITFDIDTAQTDTTSDAPYSVALGTITTSDGRVSGATDGVNFIWLDLDTNAVTGAVVTVSSTNAKLLSASSADNIPSTTAVMSNGTSNYGICVVSDTETTGGPLTKVAPFANTCAANSETNSVGGVTVAAQNIFTTNSLPISGGRGQIAVNAAISATQAAHNDYTDILKFIATGTF